MSDEIDEKKVLDFFRKYPGKDIGDLSMELQEDLTKVASIVQKLMEEGKLMEAPSQ